MSSRSGAGYLLAVGDVDSGALSDSASISPSNQLISVVFRGELGDSYVQVPSGCTTLLATAAISKR